jgi:plastocyanin
VTVQAIDNSFRPDPLEVVAGAEVVFENRGRNDHNVLPKGDPSAVAWGVQKEQFAPGDSYAIVFGAPGTYAYYCSIHGTDEIGMVGTVVVTEP